jgi:hypothetical protein
MNNQEMADDMAFRMAQSIAAAIAPLLQQATTTSNLVPKVLVHVACAKNKNTGTLRI